MSLRRQIAKTAARMLVLLFVFSAAGLEAQSQSAAAPSLVEVYWKSSRTVVAPGLSNIIVLDPEIASVQSGADTVQVFGLNRGETVAVGYMDGKPVSMRIRVVERPAIITSPGALRRQAEMAQGSVGSNVQISNGGGATNTTVLNNFYWTQPVADKSHLEVLSEMEDDNLQSGHAFNLRHASIFFHNDQTQVRLLDFVTNMSNPGSPRFVTPFMVTDAVELRGASVSLNQGRDQYTLFGGSTIPFYYLTLGSTRDIAGFSFRRQQTDKLAFFSTSSYLNIPQDFLGLSGQRRTEFMEMGGVNYAPTEHVAFQVTGGGSTHGGLIRGDAEYISSRLTLLASGTTSAPMFPLNQIESLFSGTTSAKAGITFRSSQRLYESFYYQHAVTQAVGGILLAGSSDYVNPGFGFSFTRKEQLMVNYTYSRNQGGFTNQTSTGNRVDTQLHSALTEHIDNTAQVTVGSLQDPLQLNSEDQVSFRDSVSFPIFHGNSMYAGYSHDRRSPSLVQKLNSELGLLSPALQSLFLQDPVSFVQAGNVPPDVRAILEAQNPVSDSIFASAQVRIGSKLMVSPNAALDRSAFAANQTWTPFVGYGLVYQMRPSFQLNSSMSNVWVLGASNVAQRTTLVTFGFLKTFSVTPELPFTGKRSRVIEGRVFRDSNINGYYNAGEPGLAGVQVQLEDGASAVTDAQGRYKFTDVSGGEHQVSLSLNQFREPVRMTTRNAIDVDLIRDRIAVVNFGVIDFARIMGNVFNDLRFEGKRQVDSKGIGDIRLVLDDGNKQRTIQTTGGGDFEADDIPPGDYTLSVDPASIPANYQVPQQSFPIHIAPVSTVVQDIPVQALRSISGRVFLKVLLDQNAPSDPGKLKIGGMPSGTVRNQRGGQAGGKAGQGGGQANRGVQQGGGGGTPGVDFNLVPMAGVQLRAGSSIAITDENGNFLLRNLPAGDLTVTIVPLRPPAEGIKVPSGVVHMPPEPIEVQGATIVITNPDLVPYLLDKTAAEVLNPSTPSLPKPAAGTEARTGAAPAAEHNVAAKSADAPAQSSPVAPRVKAETATHSVIPVPGQKVAAKSDEAPAQTSPAPASVQAESETPAQAPAGARQESAPGKQTAHREVKAVRKPASAPAAQAAGEGPADQHVDRQSEGVSPCTLNPPASHSVRKLRPRPLVSGSAVPHKSKPVRPAPCPSSSPAAPSPSTPAGSQ